MEWALGLCGALLPGLWAAVQARRLIATANEGDVGERIAAYRGRLVLPIAIGSLAIALAGPVPVLLVVTLWLGILAAWFTIRRAIFGDRWSFAAYVRHMSSMAIAHFGHMSLLMFAPVIVASGAAETWVIVTGLAIVLVVWGQLSDEFAFRVFGAERLIHPELRPRFEAIAARSRVRLPRILVAGPANACWPVTIAWPSTRRPTVLVSRTLLDRLASDELGAIFARDLAFLELGDARALRWAQVIDLALIGAGLALTPLAHLAGLSSAWLSLSWIAVVFLVSLALARRYTNVLGLDRRAAELCGDAEALIRALVAQSELRKEPRRSSPELEQASTSPAVASLARRIQALREAPVAPGPYRELPSSTTPPLASELIVRATEPGRWLILTSDRAHWLDGVPEGVDREAAALRAAARSVRSHVYEDLSALALEHAKGVPVLAAAERSGQAWRTTLYQDDVAAVQAALDRVDSRMGRPIVPGPSGRLGAAALLVASGVAFWWLRGDAIWPLIFAGLAFSRPAGAPLGAVAGTAFAAVAWRATVPTISPVAHVAALAPMLVLAALGGWALIAAYRQTARTDPKAVRGGMSSTTFMLVSAGFYLAMPLLATHDHAAMAWRHYLLITSPGLAIVLGGMSGALPFAVRRIWRWLAIPCIAATALLIMVAARGPSIVHSQAGLLGAPILRRGEDVSVQLVSQATLHGRFVALAPDGSRYAVVEAKADVPKLIVRDFLGGSWEVGGGDVELAFLNATEAVVMERPSDGLTLRGIVIGAPNGAPAWHVTFPDEHGIALTVDAATRSWRLISSKGDVLIRRAGIVGDPHVTEVRWPVEEGRRQVYLATAGDLGLELTYAKGEEAFELAVLDSTGRTRVHDTVAPLTCVVPSWTDDDVICIVFGPNRSELWRVDLRLRKLVVIGAVEGIATRGAMSVDGKSVLLATSGGLIRIPLAPSPAVQQHVVPLAGEVDFFEVASVPGFVATVEFRRAESILRVYRMP